MSQDRGVIITGQRVRRENILSGIIGRVILSVKSKRRSVDKARRNKTQQDNQ